MRIIITESKIEQLKNLAQEIIDDELNDLRQMSDLEWGLGEYDEINEVESVEKIVVDDVKTTNGVSIYVNVYINSGREDFDIIFSMIEYTIEKWMPNSEIHINKIYLYENNNY